MLALVATVTPGQASAQPEPRPVQLYVAPSGDDDAAGTIDDPFATLARARREVRELTPDMDSDLVVNLRGGTYRLHRALRLDAAAGDSGENGHRVVYRAYGYGTADQETPVISGGRRVRDWKLVDADRHVWRAGVGSLSTRQLYRSGRRLEKGTIAKFPGKLTRTRSGYTTASTAPQTWARPGNLEFTYTTVGYRQGMCGVDDITGNARRTTITMDQPCFRRLTKVLTYNAENPDKPLRLVRPSRIQNSPSLLRHPDTWAIDRSRPGDHRLFYRARRGKDPNDRRLVVPVRQTLVRGSGTRSHPLHDVAFEGLSFRYATWLRPDRPAGVINMFGDYLYFGGSPSGSMTEPTLRFGFVPGNLTFEHSAGLSFEGNRFTRLGADGLKLIGAKATVVRGNEFADLAGGGLKLDSHRFRDANNDNLVTNNWVHGIGRDYQGGIAVYLERTVDTVVRHNRVNGVPYSGIVADNTEQPKPAHGNRIIDNDVFDTVNVLMDGGGIYTAVGQGTSYANGALIEGNHVHGTVNPRFEKIDPDGEIGAPNALYTDVHGDFIRLRHNVVYDNHQSWGGVTPERMRFSQNFWDDDDLVWYGPTDGLRIRDNTLLTWRRPHRECLTIDRCRAIVRDAGVTPRWRDAVGLG